MIYFLYGDNDYQIDKRVTDLKNQLLTKDKNLSVVVIDINDVSAEDLMGQLTAVSLFGFHQLIIVKAVTANADCWILLEKNTAQIPNETDVILTDVATLSKVKNLGVTRTFKQLKNSGAVLEKYTLVKPYQLTDWLKREVEKRQLKMDQAAQKRLIELTAGEDNQQARIDSELTKLALLGQTIDRQIVEGYVEPSPVTNAFAILNLALTGNLARAIELTRELRDSGEEVNRFLGLLTAQELAMAVAITGAKVNISPFQVSQAKKLLHSLAKTVNQADLLKKLTARLSKLDGEIKLSSPEEAWLKVEVALADIAKLTASKEME